MESIEQRLVNSLNESMKDIRKDYHVTLGQLINVLSENQLKQVVYESPDKITVCGFNFPHSYRGYYCDLAFSPCDNISSTDDLLYILKDILDGYLEGYKGGSYQMTKDTPLWISEYGEASGLAIVDVKVSNSRVSLITKKID